jgi:hypothetical protein
VVYRFPATAVEAPDGAGFAAAAASWAYEDARFISCKAVRETPAGELALLLFAEADWPRKIASVAMLLASGEVAWGPNDYAEAHGEGTDLAVSLDGRWVQRARRLSVTMTGATFVGIVGEEVRRGRCRAAVSAS